MASPSLPPDTSSPQELRRELTLLDSTMINIGSMIGSGIFIVPAMIASQLQSTSLIIGVWVVGGIVSMFGALAMAELGALMPKAGGQFVYLREAYGPLWGFLYGWGGFIVIISASISAIAVGFATYLGYFIPLTPAEIKIVAIASILLLTAMNCFGVKLGALIQNGFTFLKIAAFALLVGLSLVLSGGSVSNFSPVLPQMHWGGLIGPLGLAMVAVLWSYDGWIEITYVAGEVRDPQKNIHRSLILSTAVVIVIYTLVNLAYIYVLSVGKIAQSRLVASDVATVLLGPFGASAIACAVMIATFGANNGFVFTGARIYYAMAKEGLFFKSFGKIHPVYGTPIASLAGQGLWSSLLVLTGSYDQLTTYVVFVSWAFYAMSCIAVFILRKQKPNLARPYKTWGYPWTPALFVLFAGLLVMNTIVENPIDSLIGTAMIVLGIPAYFYWSKKKR